jgi:heme/copper-type cytochrome/quinol oxidase subunit 2
MIDAISKITITYIVMLVCYIFVYFIIFKATSEQYHDIKEWSYSSGIKLWFTAFLRFMMIGTPIVLTIQAMNYIWW